MEILRQYEENGMKITEYTKDGVTIHAIVREAIPTIEENPQPVTLEELNNKLEETKQDNLILMDAIATLFEEVLRLQEMQGGTV
jgi:KaiC/GvpD/RAD55 family RecA-like ATPase